MGPHAHPAGRLDRIRVDAVHTDIRVRQHERERKDDESEDDVRRADTEDAEADRDHGETRQRSADVREVDRKERSTVQMTEPDAERDRDQERDPHRLAADDEVLDYLRPHQTRVVVHESERVDERARAEGVVAEDHVALRARIHGVNAHCNATSAESAARASATASAPVATNSVVKSVCSPLKIGWPRPSGVM